MRIDFDRRSHDWIDITQSCVSLGLLELYASIDERIQQ
jgi:hypothetical protein